MAKITNKVIIHADGGSRGNPGQAAIGIVICDENMCILKEFCEPIGLATSNEAEYYALIKALEIATKHTRKEVQIFMDSELVIKQITGEYRIKAENLKPLFKEVKDNEGAFDKVVYNYVPRENRLQAKADTLVNKALDEM